jgi:SAM-dependent methyltransferase
MFTESAELYDVFYSSKDYAAEAERLRGFIAAAGGPGGGALLDVACGTGGHTGPLRAHYEVEGLDLDAGLLAVARRKEPEVAFHHGDMRDFDLGRRFDVVTCLFSSIGYVRTVEAMRGAVANLARHLRPGGALVIEPWLTPDAFSSGNVSVQTHDEPGLKRVRMHRSWAEGVSSTIEFHYLIGTPDGITHRMEQHHLGLFTHEQMTDAMKAAGLRVSYDPEGLIGRGLYVGIVAG